MADGLSYQDVKNALRETVGPMQQTLQSLRSDISSVRNVLDRLNVKVDILERASGRHDPKSEHTMQQMLQYIQNIELRLRSVEKSSQTLDEYFEAKLAEEDDEREYRGT